MRRHSFHIVALAALLIGPAVVAAESVNKCTDGTGKVVYQKEPCNQEQRSEQKQIDPNQNSVKMEAPPPSGNTSSDSARSGTGPAATSAPATIRRRKSGGGY